ncbi:MAG: MATE family efflux transporter [Myxococcota bacterium]
MWSEIISLSLPIIGATLSQNLFNLVDTAMIGRLGPASLAACGVGGMLNWVIVAVFIGLSVGVQAISARRYGEGDAQASLAVLNNSILLLLVTLPYTAIVVYFAKELFALFSNDAEVIAEGVPYLTARLVSIPFVGVNFAFAGYLNGVHKAGEQLKVVVFIHIANIILNFVLIFGFSIITPMGTLGAGVGTALASLFGTFYYVYLVLRMESGRRFFRFASLSREIIGGIFKLSYPICFQQLSLSASLLAFYWVAGLIGVRELAATNIVLKIAMLCILPCVGLGTAATSLVSSSLGGGDREMARRWGRETIYIGVIYTMGMAGMFVAAPDFWLSLFVDDPKTVLLGVVPLLVMAVGEVVDGMGIIYSRVLTGAGASRKVMTAMLLLQWGWFLPLAYALSVSLGGGIAGLWTAWLIYRATFAAVMLVYFRKSDWETILV